MNLLNVRNELHKSWSPRSHYYCPRQSSFRHSLWIHSRGRYTRVYTFWVPTLATRAEFLQLLIKLRTLHLIEIITDSKPHYRKVHR